MINVKVPKILSHQSHSKMNGRGHRWTTKEYKQYQNIIGMQLAKLPKIESKEPVKVELIFNCNDRRVGDIDNITKPVLDTLQKKGKLYDDRYIEKLKVSKTFGHKECSIDIRIERLKNE